MTNPPYELTDGRSLPVVAEYDGHDYRAYVLHDADASAEWILTWNDGINFWYEEYDYPWHVFARLAALVAAADQQVLLVHDLQDGDPITHAAVVEEVENFIARTVHAFNCPPDCDGTSGPHEYLHDTRNQITGTVTGTVVQARDLHGGLQL